MIQQLIYLAGGVTRWRPAIFFTPLLFLLMSPVQAGSENSFPQAVRHDTPVNLSQVDTRYALISRQKSSGFIVAPDDLTLDKTIAFITAAQSDGLKPDFRRHKRYWLYTEVINDTDTPDWVLHVSNFGYEKVQVLLRGKDKEHLQIFQNTGYESGTDINTIGRAIKLKLQPGESYLLAVELKANNVVWSPYIALMSASHYQDWAAKMDYAFKLAVGIVIGLALLAFICWIFVEESVFFWAGLSSFLMLCYYLEHSSVPAIFWQSSYERTFLFWLLMSASLLSLLAFAASFLQVNKHSGRWYQVFAGTALITVVVLIVGTLLPFNHKGLLYAVNYMLIWGVILSSGMAKVRSEGRFYIFYILGWLPMVLSILHVIYTLFLPHEIGPVITASYKLIYVQYVQISHMLIHAVALILRIKTLREDRLQTEYISQAKSRFIAQSSHDLQQPLNSMSIFLDYLQPYVHGEKGQQIFSKLKHTRQQLYNSFNSIMDFSKFEAEAVLPDMTTVSIASALSKIQHEYQPLAAEKNIKLNIHSTSLKIRSDPVLLERLLRNLVSNAIKYTHSGKVVVGCRRRGEHVLVQVLDTGCGIAKNDQKFIFDIYHRSIQNPKQTAGSGIGLSIVKHIADLLDYPLSIQSTLGKGSAFCFTAPRAESLEINTQKEANSSDKLLVAALVFQDDDLREVMNEYLTKWHCLVKKFRTVEEACQFYTIQEIDDMAADILLCEYATLSAASLPPKRISELTRNYIAACACKPGTPLPENWIALSIPAQPSQLRALLNAVARKRQIEMESYSKSEA